MLKYFKVTLWRIDSTDSLEIPWVFLWANKLTLVFSKSLKFTFIGVILTPVAGATLRTLLDSWSMSSVLTLCICSRYNFKIKEILQEKYIKVTYIEDLFYIFFLHIFPKMAQISLSHLIIIRFYYFLYGHQIWHKRLI